MTFTYKAVTNTGEKKEGAIDAPSRDLAIAALQRRGLIVVSILAEGEHSSIFQRRLFERVPVKDVVILSRQISTLFEAQVSALKAFTLLASNAENPLLRRKLTQVTDDLQAGSTISGALSRHPDVFSEFYVNMVKAGEESGKLNQVFSYLAEYLDRQYELTKKTKNALIYPAFVITVFIFVMILMFVLVIPKLSAIIEGTGQEIPFYTRMVIGVSQFFVNYGVFLALAVLLGVLYVWYMSKTRRGKLYLDELKITAPVAGKIYSRLYLSRIADNMDTMLSAGISIVRSIEITSKIVGSRIYEEILVESAEAVKAGSSFSDALAQHKHVPQIMVQMVKVGEETGGLSNILKTLAKFYKREVDDAIDTLVSLIEPVMIVILGLGVGVLLTSVLVPIYNIASGIS